MRHPSRRSFELKEKIVECLEKINPSYFDLLLPLSRWKILSVRDLKGESEYGGSDSGFYKIISKLEKNLLIDSFFNQWSNEKFVYLSSQGAKALGKNSGGLNINRDLRFHDSLVTKVARKFLSYSFVKDLYLDFQVKEAFPLVERTPDCLIQGEIKRPFNLAIEVELTQKNRDRVREIFQTYGDSKVVNHVLYITDKKAIFNAYKKYLTQLGGEKICKKILIMHAKNLAKGTFVLERSPIFFNYKETNLAEVFGTPMLNEER